MNDVYIIQVLFHNCELHAENFERVQEVTFLIYRLSDANLIQMHDV